MKNREEGLASSIRLFFKSQKINILDIQKSVNYYDICTKFIANHEIAHAYVGQLSPSTRSMDNSEIRAFEYIVDLISTQWLYKKVIINTPNSQEYFEFRGLESYSDCIYFNALSLIEGQVLIFLLFAFAGAIINRGKVYLDGGDFHPHSLFRYYIQNIHFMTLLESNFQNHLSSERIEQIQSYALSFLGLFARIGFFSENDLNIISDKNRYNDFLNAYNLVDEFDIKDLKKSKELFKIVQIMKDSSKINKLIKFITNST